MPAPVLPKFNTGDRVLSGMQDYVSQAFLKLYATVALLNGKLLKDIDIATTGTTFPHNLGRSAQGWIVVRSSANAAVWDSASNPKPEVNLALTASADVTVTLWVF